MQLGTVSAIYRYPVKAMAAERLEQAQIGWHGVAGDRRYAFVQSDDASDFPWLTIRQLPALTRYRPRSADPPESGAPIVVTPDGRELTLSSPELAAELAAAHGGPVHLHRSSRGLFDAFAVSITSMQTAASVGALAGAELAPLRFRPTIVIDAPGADYPEDALLGRRVALGDAHVRVNVRDERCMVINFDP